MSYKLCPACGQETWIPLHGCSRSECSAKAFWITEQNPTLTPRRWQPLNDASWLWLVWASFCIGLGLGLWLAKGGWL